MIILVKEDRQTGKHQYWTGVAWSKEKGEARVYRRENESGNGNGGAFDFGTPAPVVEEEKEILHFLQLDCRQKWRMLGVPSPEEILAALQYQAWLKEVREREQEQEREELELAYREPEDDEEMSWERAAKNAITTLLKSLVWEGKSGSILITRNYLLDDQEVECTNYGDLLSALEAAGQEAWDGEVPWDDERGRAYEMDDVIDIRKMLHEHCEKQLKKLKWER